MVEGTIEERSDIKNKGMYEPIRLKGGRMDFYKFINSCDIREHLQNLKYGFNAKEAVWLVYQSCETTVSEHIEACRYIVENMPDVPLGESNNCFIGSLDLSSKVSKTSDLSDLSENRCIRSWDRKPRKQAWGAS